MMDGLINALNETVKEVSSYKDFIPSFNEKLKSGIESFNDADKPLVNRKEIEETNYTKGCPIEGHGGTWSGERGNSNWYLDRDVEPGDRNGTNPEHKKWGDILDKYGIDYIPFRGGEIDFSEISKGTVEIDDFSSDRDSNFDQADEKLAEQRECTPEEIAKWRKENAYTWHECKDCKTMQMVPTEVHGNIPHSGGISEAKAIENLANS